MTSQDDTPLTETELQAFEAKLDDRQTALHDEVRTVQEANEADRDGFAGVPPDMVDLAEHRRGEDMRHAERERDELELVEIAQARQRLADGRFGECVDCGEAIARARLDAQPWAARCLPCQERHERTHGSAVPTVATGADNR